MIVLVPHSNGEDAAPVQEFNPCHSPEDGKFCSYLKGEWTRGEKLGIQFDIDRGLPISQSSFSPGGFGGGRVGLGLQGSPLYPARRGVVLSVARHEVGHGTSRDYVGEFETTHPSHRRIGGQRFGAQYTSEFGAWKAAVRDAPHHRVDWSVVRQSLGSYIREDGLLLHRIRSLQGPEPNVPASDAHQRSWQAYGLSQGLRADQRARLYDQTLTQHLTILKRYARRLRGSKKKAA